MLSSILIILLLLKAASIIIIIIGIAAGVILDIPTVLYTPGWNPPVFDFAFQAFGGRWNEYVVWTGVS